MINISHLSKRFGNLTALDDVSLHIPRGSIYGLLGPNGAGKTTLLRILNRIIEPDSGTVLVDGKPLAEFDTADIGYMPEERGLYRKMTVESQARYFARLKGLDSRKAAEAANSWLQRLELQEQARSFSTQSEKTANPVASRETGELSKGTQQKLQFIIAAIHNPRLLILDEPFSGLDPVATALLMRIIKELAAGGTTMILSTHDMNAAESLCDHIALIDHARLVLQGDTGSIRHNGQPRSFKLVEVLPSLNDIFLSHISQQ